MGVGDKDKVDVGQLVDFDAGVSEAADGQEPVCPIWVDEDVGL